ncbi:hypothetical protein MVEN_02209200 [Mycena venus]|uniref:Uncharacterized protein n=1 Tax=Mycena venus TaxID=2733690 RepID=A0A8H6X6P9_9AGAR|nr:hypothetical protein MVEN_02209200 [Mycena venus]
MLFSHFLLNLYLRKGIRPLGILPVVAFQSALCPHHFRCPSSPLFGVLEVRHAAVRPLPLRNSYDASSTTPILLLTLAVRIIDLYAVDILARASRTPAVRAVREAPEHCAHGEKGW